MDSCKYEMACLSEPTRCTLLNCTCSMVFGPLCEHYQKGDNVSWQCIKDIRRWADEDIENVGRDVLRRQAHHLADVCLNELEAIEKNCDKRISAMASVHAETAHRNVRVENEIRELREKLRQALDSRNMWSKLEAENAALRMEIRELKERLKDG